MTIEHELFYPEARDVDEDQIGEAFEEHAIAEVALKRALACDPDDEVFDARITVLKELIAHHVEEEENELFPEVESALSEERLETLGQQMEKRFDQVLREGYASVLPKNMEDTAADLAQREAAE
jgi:hemerythrin-like domain-containing protein